MNHHCLNGVELRKSRACRQRFNSQYFYLRAIVDFPKFLGIAMEAFLSLCDDAESDVRMVADECLNRTIKVQC